jgi:hypothetical protein
MKVVNNKSNVYLTHRACKTTIPMSVVREFGLAHCDKIEFNVKKLKGELYIKVTKLQ